MELFTNIYKFLQMFLTLFTSMLIFLFGVAVGSFLNVLIDRLPKDEKITGRSHCDHCKKTIPWYDLIPVFSFFVLKARCRYCKKKISWQYPLIEILTGLAFVIIWTFSFSPIILSTVVGKIIILGIVSCLIVIFFSDLKYHLISDYIQVSFFLFSLLFHLIVFNQLPYYLLSGLIVGLSIFLIYYLSKERAMGLGDVYLALNIGFLLGWQAGFLALYIAFVTGAVFGTILILLKKKKIKSKISFGPFLVIGTIIMLFYGDKIMELIRKVYGF